MEMAEERVFDVGGKPVLKEDHRVTTRNIKQTSVTLLHLAKRQWYDHIFANLKFDNIYMLMCR